MLATGHCEQVSVLAQLAAERNSLKSHNRASASRIYYPSVDLVIFLNFHGDLS